MQPETRTKRFLRWLATLVGASAAFAFIVLGGVIGHGVVGKVVGCAIGAFVGGLIVAQIGVPRRSQLTVAAGWSAFALVSVLAGYGVFMLVPNPNMLWVFFAAGIVGGFLGGVIAAVIQGPTLWRVPRSRVQWSMVESAALTAASTVFLIVMRLELPALALPLAALLYASMKQFQPQLRA